MENTHFETRYPAKTMNEEVEKTLRLVEMGNFVQVIGLPGTGKSTLLKLLAYNSAVKEHHLGDKTSSYHFVYMNFSEVKNREIFEVIKFMLLSLHNSLLDRGLTQEAAFVNGKIDYSLSRKDEMIYFQALKQSIEYLAGSYKLVFLIDRLETCFQNITEQFFANLRILRNSAKYSFSVVFSLDRPLDMTLDISVVSDIWDLVSGNSVFVGVSHPDGLSFRLTHLEETTRKSCDKNIKDNLIKITGGHGKLTKLGYEALLSEGCEQADLSQFLLLRRQIKGALSEIWNYFTLEEQATLILLRDKRDESAQIEVIGFLNSLGILKDSAITIPLFDTYTNDKKPQAEVIVYDAERKTILRGGNDISEMFSPSEFRLLRFMLENNNSVVSRDELIDFIWGDLATREGVTPQAFDQLVYRVRKKIEEDPSNPVILTTIKGRGYKFNS